MNRCVSEIPLTLALLCLRCDQRLEEDRRGCCGLSGKISFLEGEMEGVLNPYASECSELAATLTRVTGGGEVGAGRRACLQSGRILDPCCTFLFCVLWKLSLRKRGGAAIFKILFSK